MTAAKIKLNAGSGGGAVRLEAPSSTSHNRVIDLPDLPDGTLLTNHSSLDATKLSGTLPAISAANLTNIPAANLTGALPAISGANLTNLPTPTAFVSGMIILWSGATNAIPSGWVICDGNNSTPDLRDRFVVGAGNNYSVGATGGATTDSISVSVSISGTTGSPSATDMAGFPNAKNLATGSHTHSFSGSGSGSATVDTLPPYYALAYIMKT